MWKDIGMEINWNDVGKVIKFIFDVVAKLGGSAAFFAIIMLFLQKRIDFRYAKKTYVSKVRFDAEFDIYKKLSKSFFEMVKNITILIPVGIGKSFADKNTQDTYQNTLYEQSMKSTESAQDILYESAPFISKSMFEEYKELLELCHTQIITFEIWKAEGASERFKDEDYLRSENIMKKMHTLNDKIRAYLSELEVR